MEIRRTLFRFARAHHPVTQEETLRTEVIQEAARELACAPEVLMEGLYADLPENQKLCGFKHLNAIELLNLYNLARLVSEDFLTQLKFARASNRAL